MSLFNFGVLEGVSGGLGPGPWSPPGGVRDPAAAVIRQAVRADPGPQATRGGRIPGRPAKPREIAILSPVEACQPQAVAVIRSGSAVIQPRPGPLKKS